MTSTHLSNTILWFFLYNRSSFMKKLIASLLDVLSFFEAFGGYSQFLIYSLMSKYRGFPSNSSSTKWPCAEDSWCWILISGMTSSLLNANIDDKVASAFTNWLSSWVSYPNFVRGPLFVSMRPSFDHFKMFNTHHRGSRKVLGCFGEKSTKNTKMGVYLAKWGCV